MQNNPENFSPEDSLRLIQAMIDKTRTNLADNSFYFLLWGWLVLIACLLQFTLLKFFHSPYHYYAWALMWVGIIVMIFTIRKEKMTRRVKTYIGDSMIRLWTGIGISFLIVGWICAFSGWINAFPLYILLYATGSFLSGSFMKFRPLITGGVICWALALVAALVPYEWQILVTALAVILSYIIPGYLLKKEYSRQAEEQNTVVS